MKLATVKLKNKKTGRVMKLNQTDYAAHMVKYARDWDVITWQRGDASNAQEVASRKAAELEESRRRDPERLRRFENPDEKRQEQRSLAGHNIVTEKEPGHGDTQSEPLRGGEGPSSSKTKGGGKAEPEGPEADAEKEVAEPHWTMLPWPARKKHVRITTGKVPRNMKHAVELMRGEK